MYKLPPIQRTKVPPLPVEKYEYKECTVSIFNIGISWIGLLYNLARHCRVVINGHFRNICFYRFRSAIYIIIQEMKENQWSEIIVSKYNMIIISDLPNFTRNEHSTIMCITQYIFWAYGFKIRRSRGILFSHSTSSLLSHPGFEIIDTPWYVTWILGNKLFLLVIIYYRSESPFCHVCSNS